jgi:hypothetical protein
VDHAVAGRGRARAAARSGGRAGAVRSPRRAPDHAVAGGRRGPERGRRRGVGSRLPRTPATKASDGGPGMVVARVGVVGDADVRRRRHLLRLCRAAQRRFNPDLREGVRRHVLVRLDIGALGRPCWTTRRRTHRTRCWMPCDGCRTAANTPAFRHPGRDPVGHRSEVADQRERCRTRGRYPCGRGAGRSRPAPGFRTTTSGEPWDTAETSSRN